jgi:enoyl-CoA hydratase/3-hydroxyacyl-CoA dehydrogenase
MLRLAAQVGPELTKYYVFTGDPISARKAHDLGLVARLVEPADVDTAIGELVRQGAPDKNRTRELPAGDQALAKLCAGGNLEAFLAGRTPEPCDDAALAAKTAKKISYKAPLALKMANEIIDQQVGQPAPAAIEIELGRLNEIFSSADALEGLTSMGRKKPKYTGQ